MRGQKLFVRPIEAAGLSSKMIEAQGFALFGYLALKGRPVGGAWTGAKEFGPPAHLIPGKNWESVLARLS